LPDLFFRVEEFSLGLDSAQNLGHLSKGILNEWGCIPFFGDQSFNIDASIFENAQVVLLAVTQGHIAIHLVNV